MITIQQLINTELRKKQNEREPRNQTTWHASALGSCLCSQYLSRLGMKPDKEIDDRTLRVFQMGNQIEDWVIDLIKKQEGYESGLLVETQGRVFDEKLSLSGYYDLKLKHLETGQEIINEIKSKNSRSFWYMDKQGQGAQLSHQMQLWAYLYVLGVEEGRIIYISKDDLSILEYPIFRSDEKLKELVLDQLDILNEAWDKKIPPLPAPKDSWMAKYCSHHKQCLQVEKYLEREPLFYRLELQKVVSNKKSIII